jgi:hypothetical protein
VFIPPERSSIYQPPERGTGAARPSYKENKFHNNSSPSGELKITTGGDSHFKQTPSRNPLLLLRKSEPLLQQYQGLNKITALETPEQREERMKKQQLYSEFLQFQIEEKKERKLAERRLQKKEEAELEERVREVSQMFRGRHSMGGITKHSRDSSQEANGSNQTP